MRLIRYSQKESTELKNKLSLIKKYLQKDSLRKLTRQGLWIGQYARRYWKAMVLYTLLGVMGTGVSLVSSLISKDLVDIITGHETGRLISTFAAMIGFSIGNILVAQASGYASTLINLKVDTEIKNDIFAKMMVTDWESLTTYHTGDLVTRWSSDASNIIKRVFQTFRQSKPLILLNFISKNWVLFKKNTLECALSFRECQFLLLF